MPSDNVRTANAYCACAESNCTSCASMIRSLLPAGSPEKTVSWAFIGSSTMMRTVNAIKGVHQVMTTWTGHRGSAGRCNFGQFLGVETVPEGDWVPPVSGKEGPVLHGLEHPGCTDCSGCDAWRSGEAVPSVDYLPSEYARDVEIQTNTTNTTQETLGVYLAH